MVNNKFLSNSLEISANQESDKLNISHWLFLLFWLLKPFYLWESGSIQVSDFVFLMSFAAWLVINRGNILIEGHNLYFFLFITFTLVINIAYLYILKDLSYLVSTFYYVYNFLVILIFSDFKHNKTFLKALLWASAFNLFVQLAILTLGLGSYFWGDFRFMGSFNDPNQFSFSMFTSFLIVYILSQYFYNQENHSRFTTVLVAFALAFYFVVQGSSTGMLLGFIVFVLMMVVSFINLEKTPAFVFLKFSGILLIACIILIVAAMGFSGPSLEASPDSSSFLFFRMTQKLDILSGGGFEALLKDRGMDKIISYPFYLIFGAGEGSFIERFPESVYEVHSTFPGILFYYGIIPFIILCAWIWHHVKSIHLMLLPVYFALLMESLTLANQRQPAFWMIIILGSLSYMDKPKHNRIKMMRKI